MKPGVCVLTGAANGIGYGIAERFLRGGWAVVGLDIDRDALRESAKRLVDLGEFHAVEGDVTCQEDLARARDTAAELGELRCWINNAGFNIAGEIHELDTDSYDRGVAVNLSAVFWGTAIATRHFLASEIRGNVINISSVTALIGLGNLAAYAMCKGGVISLTREVAVEYIRRGIRCNAIAPGVIDTQINQKLVADSADADAERHRLEARTPMGRPGTPKDVAEAAFFLGSEETAGYITGEVLVVDGGCTVISPGS